MTKNKTVLRGLKAKTEEEKKALEESRTALMNMLEDVEEARKLAEGEKNKTLTIIDNLTDGLLMFDESNKLYLMNPQAEKFFGVGFGEIIGRAVSEIVRFPKLAPLANLLRGENKKLFKEELLLKDNLVVEITTVSITTGKSGLGTLVILHDVTREKAIEKLKTEFVSLSAHQLRTPLSAIKWTLRMILDGDLGEITEEQKEYLEKTYLSNERMINLINDLLNVARIEEGKYVFKPQPVDISEVVQFAINSYQDQIKRKEINLEFRKPKTRLPKIEVDIEKIRLAVQNLLDNAVSYTPEKGKVTVSLRGDKGQIEFSIQDTGIGIPKDQQGRVFGKFFRTQEAVRMKTRGTGLGLYIAKNIIEAHGGKVWFESEESKGSTFYFTLPAFKKSE